MKKQMLNFPMEPDIKDLLDSYAEESGLKKYKIIGNAITEYVNNRSKRNKNGD